jgi:tetratricopeptide (TPR) repeat protein
MLLIGGGRPAYQWWRQRRTDQFKTECAAATDQKDWERLDRVAGRWLAWDAGSSDAYVYLAEAQLQTGRTAEAAESLARVNDDYRGALQALAMRAEFLFSELNRPYEAVETWKRMLRINPRASLPRQRLIYFYAMSLQRRDMTRQIRDAMQLGCEPKESYPYLLLAHELNFTDGLDVITRWRKTYPGDEALEVAQAVYAVKNVPSQTMRTSGRTVVAPGDPTLINACLDKYPHNLEVLAFHLEQGVFNADEELVSRLLGQAPVECEHDSRFWRARGWLLSVQGADAEATAAFEQALRTDPFDWHSRYNYAEALRLQGLAEEASRMAELAGTGKSLSQEIFQLAGPRLMEIDLVERILPYVEEVGDERIVSAIRRRIPAKEGPLMPSAETPAPPGFPG